MITTDDILWFKLQFADKVKAAIKDTPFSIDMIVAVACQETGYIWSALRKKQLSNGDILELCVGDTLDASKGRKAFPKTKTDLLASKDGDKMFAIARQALLDMAKYIPGYSGAANNPAKFCHGFGIFQYDIQFFKEDPGYFLQKRYADFDASLGKCIKELKNAFKRAGFSPGDALTDLQMAYVAIAYNTGSFKPARGLKQGHFDKKRYYGEYFFDYLRLSKTVVVDGVQPVLQPAGEGIAVISMPTPIIAGGILYEVDVHTDPLRLRKEPKKSSPDPNSNVIARLPDGHIVKAITNKKVNEFLEVETSLLGAHFRGFAAADFLKRAKDVAEVPVITPSPEPPSAGIIAVYMPKKDATVTRRSQPANAHSLNEAGQPLRTGTTPDELRSSIAAIIDWLAVDKASHKRYQPVNRSTFCNIYTHDFCYLSGVYLPRVWWSQKAIIALTRGETVQPKYGDTIDELRANDLYRWLRDFGPDFGWRQTGTLTKLQTEVNQGAIGLIVARRKVDGMSGHIVAVVPETKDFAAKLNAAGEVVMPVQSQAGVTNFRYGLGKQDWWKGEQFAESAFWIHA